MGAALACSAEEPGAAAARALLQAKGSEVVVSAMDRHPESVEVQHWGSVLADLVEAAVDAECPPAAAISVPEDDAEDANDTESTADTAEADRSTDVVVPETPECMTADGNESVGTAALSLQ